MRRVDRDTVLAALDAQGFTQTLGEELAALVEYERWRAAYDAGSGSVEMEDGEHRTRAQLDAWVRARSCQGTLLGLRKGGAA